MEEHVHIDFMHVLVPGFLVSIIISLIVILSRFILHIFFIRLFGAGTILFLVFLANSTRQDGHGEMPLMSMCLKDTISTKLFNLINAFLFGLIFFIIGF